MSSNTVPVPASDVAIRIENISKCYRTYDRPRDRLKQLFAFGRRNYFREFWALKNISFEIKRGDTVGIIGRNGSGKSTLLQLICGTLNQTEGDIVVNGKVAALLELGAGFNPEFTGRENVFMNASLYGLTKAQITERFDKIEKFADIGRFMDQPVKTYSSGMFVRLAFAVIAHVDADVLVIDEALAVGDAYFVQKCMRFLRSFTEKGTLLFVSHDTSAVVGLCSKAILLNQGTLERSGSPKDVAEFYLKKLHQLAETKKETTDQNPATAEKSDFDSSNDFGTGAAQITSVQILSDSGAALTTFLGGESVTLKVKAKAKTTIQSPIIGFFVKDKLGQALFGENTFTEHTISDVVAPGQTLEAIFRFTFPKLASGSYSFTVAIASGTREAHEQLHWIHDAVIAEVIQDKHRYGIFEPDFQKVGISYS